MCSSSQLLTKSHDVSSVTPVVRTGIEHFADEVDAKTADSGLFGRKRDVWFGLIERIEFFSVVADFDVERILRHLEADSDLMLRGIIESVFDDIGHDFLDGEVGGEDDFGRCIIALEEPRRRVSRCSKIIEIVIDLEDEIGSRGILDAEDCSQFLAEDQAGSDDGGAEEAHGPNAQGAGNKTSIAEQLIEFVNGLCDRIVLLSLGED